MKSAKSDVELVQMALEGRAGYEELMRRYLPRVYSAVIQILRSDVDAEDVTQEAFVLTFEKLGTYDTTRPFAPWVTKIAVNLALKLLAKRKDLPIPLASTPEPESRSHLADALAGPAISKDEILREVDGLGTNYRTSFLLFHVEGLSYSEVALAMGVSAANVKNYLFRARRTLRKALAGKLAAKEAIE